MQVPIKTVLLFLLIFCSGFSQQNKEIVEWESGILKWEDFQVLPQEANMSHAKSRILIGSRNRSKNFVLYVSVVAQFHKNRSWLKGKPTAHLLNHEQGHFDIMEYYSRLFRKEMASYKFESSQKIREEMTALNKKYVGLSKVMQGEYDLETNHSIVKDKQEEWDAKIKSLLVESEQFSNPKVEVDFSYLK